MKKKIIYISIFTCVVLTSIFIIKNNDIVDSPIEESADVDISTDEIISESIDEVIYETIVESGIPDDEILEEIEYNPCFAIDVDSVKNMYKESDAVYIVDNLVKGECKYSRKGNPVPTTFYSANIVKSLKENKADIESNLDIISIGVGGGFISVRDYVDNLDEDKKQISSIAKTPEEDMDKYIKISDGNYKELSNNSKYVVFLGYDEELDSYGVLASGYGVYEYNEKDSTISNSLTGRTEKLSVLNKEQ